MRERKGPIELPANLARTFHNPTIQASLTAINRYREEVEVTSADARRIFAYTVFIDDPNLLPQTADLLSIPPGEISAYIDSVHKNEDLRYKAGVIFEYQNKKDNSLTRQPPSALPEIRETLHFLLHEPIVIGSINQQIRRYFPYVLSPLQIHIVGLTMEGKTNKEIAQATEYSPGYVRDLIVDARKVLDDILALSNIHRVSRYQDTELPHHQSQKAKRLKRETFLRVPYTNDTSVQKFESHLKSSHDRVMAEQGQYPLAQMTAHYRTIKESRRYRQFIKKRGKWLYISHERLKMIEDDIARRKRRAELRRKRNSHFDRTFKRLTSQLEEILTAEQIMYIQEADTGYSNHEIAQKYHISADRVERQISKARKKVEKERLEPEGIQKTSAFGKAIQQAGYRGSYRSIIFARMPYTTDWHVNRFRVKQREVDPKLTQKGLVPLLPLVREGVISQNEYDLFRHKKRFSSFVVRNKNRIYIDPQDIPKMREMIHPPTRPKNSGIVFDASENAKTRS